MAFDSQYICDKNAKHIFTRLTDHDPRITKGRKPSCPFCKSKKITLDSHSKVNGNMSAETVQLIRDTKKIDFVPGAPAIRSNNPRIKAWDETQKIVAEDYGMTDLNVGSLREGDTMVPKLRPDLEEKVGKGWNSNQKNNVAGLAGTDLNKAITANINSNRYANQSNIVDRAMSVVQRPVTNIIGHYQPEKPS